MRYSAKVFACGLRVKIIYIDRGVNAYMSALNETNRFLKLVGYP